MNKRVPRSGEIWMCALEKSEGSVQSGYRPVLILSNDKNNTYSPTLNVIPITSKMNKRKLPVHVELWDYWKYGLKTSSTLMIEQITTVPANSLGYYMGAIEDEDVLIDICNAFCVQFPIMQMVSSA